VFGNALPTGYLAHPCVDTSGQRCGCFTLLKRKAAHAAGVQCRVHGKNAATGAAELVTALRHAGYEHPILTEFPISSAPNCNTSRRAKSRVAPVCKKSSKAKCMSKHAESACSSHATGAAKQPLQPTCKINSKLKFKTAGADTNTSRTERGGQFCKGKNLKLDLALRTQAGEWLGIEIQGDNHRVSKAVQQQDADKARAARDGGIKVHAVEVWQLEHVHDAARAHESADWLLEAELILRQL
jgi:hypothetical protein